MGKFIDMTGWKMWEHGVPNSRLTVIEKTEVPNHIKNKKKHIYWRCKCLCGNNNVVARGDSLRDGTHVSCGCYNNENAISLGKRSKKYNTFEFHDEYAVGYTTSGEKFYIDLEDYNKIKEYCWFLSHGYVVANRNDNVGCLRLHRFVTNAPDGMVVDHINHITTDCRKSNLRVVTPTENNMNHRIRSDNKSGCTGVCWSKVSKKWSVEIKLHGNRVYLGLYDDLDTALAIRKEAEEQYFGEFSYDNSVNKQRGELEA